MAYSLDLRKRVLRAWDSGMDAERVAAKYEVSRAWVHRLVQRRRETGSNRAAEADQVSRPGLVTAAGSTIGRVDDRAARRDVGRVAGGVADHGRVEHAVADDRALGFHRKKKTVYADEQRRTDVAAARRHWQAVQPLRDARHYILLDESGVTTDLLRRYGRSRRGLRLRDSTPCGHW